MSTVMDLSEYFELCRNVNFHYEMIDDFGTWRAAQERYEHARRHSYDSEFHDRVWSDWWRYRVDGEVTGAPRLEDYQ